jgi:hypothetical protein
VTAGVSNPQPSILSGWDRSTKTINFRSFDIQPVHSGPRALYTGEGTRVGIGFGGPRRTEVSAGVSNPQSILCGWDRSTKKGQ